MTAPKFFDHDFLNYFACSWGTKSKPLSRQLYDTFAIARHLSLQPPASPSSKKETVYFIGRVGRSLSRQE